MKLKNFRKFLTLATIGSMLLTGAGSLCVSAGNGDENLASNVAPQQENQENVYLQNHGIEKEEYDEFLALSGLNFDETKNILETYQDINFKYIYELSKITKNYWAHYKQTSLSKREIFFQALDVARALHIECDNVHYLEKLLEFNLISLHDVDIFVRKGFSKDQKKALSVEDLAKRVSKIAAKTHTDFFRNDFKSTGYSAYGICSNIIELSGWTFDKIDDCLKGMWGGISGLERIAICCKEDKNLDFSDVVETFKSCASIKMDDVCYLYREIVEKRGFGFGDLVKVVDEFEGFTLKNLVDAAESAKKSGRTFSEEFEHKYL